MTAAADLVFAGIARQADARRAGGDERPLLGVPIAGLTVLFLGLPVLFHVVGLTQPRRRLVIALGAYLGSAWWFTGHFSSSTRY